MVRKVLAPAVEWYMSERARILRDGGAEGLGSRRGWWTLEAVQGGGADAVDFGVFVDYASMYQKPRTPEQDGCFRRALDSMDVFYAHTRTVRPQGRAPAPPAPSAPPAPPARSSPPTTPLNPVR